MQHYAGIDVSLEWSSVCVVDATGQIIREAKVLSEPEALVAFLLELPVSLARIGLEAGPLSQHLHAALVAAGLASILIETRHVKVALSAMTVKTDRNDARGIAHLMRLGWFRPVHAKTLSAQEVRALLTARKQLQTKLIDLEISLRGILRGFGLKVGTVARGGFEGRIQQTPSQVRTRTPYCWMRPSNPPRADRPHLEPESAQDPAQTDLEVDQLGLELFARRQQGAHFLGAQGFGVHRPKPAEPHQVGDATGIVAVSLHGHGRQGDFDVPRLDQDRG